MKAQKIRLQATAMATILALSHTSSSQTPKIEVDGAQQMKEAFQAQIPKSSQDTTPIMFSVVGVEYRVPRNYIVAMQNWSGGDQGLVRLKVNLPGLEPYDKNTAPCFEHKVPLAPDKCDPLEFWISGGRGFTALEQFNNIRSNFRSQEPIETTNGFEKYEIGPDDARWEEYTKIYNGRFEYFSCQIWHLHDRRAGICHPHGTTQHGLTVDYLISLEHLDQLSSIDESLRALVDGFALDNGDKK